MAGGGPAACALGRDPHGMGQPKPTKLGLAEPGLWEGFAEEL